MKSSVQSLIYLCLIVFITKHAAALLLVDLDAMPDFSKLSDRDFVTFGEELNKRMDSELTAGKAVEAVARRAEREKAIIPGDQVFLLLNETIKGYNQNIAKINNQIVAFNNEANRRVAERKKKSIFSFWG